MVKQERQAPPRQARDGATERRILDAASAVFLKRGTAGARMQEIAREAGVNHALLHYYFRSKAQLAAAVFERAAGTLLPAVLEVIASTRPLGEKVQEVVNIELDHLTRAPHLPAYIISELAHHPERVRQLVAQAAGAAPDEVGRRVTTVLKRQIAGAVRRGEIRSIDPAQFIVNLLSLCIFPFAARPLLMGVLGMDDAAFAAFIARRRVQLPEFFMEALRP
jgi:AcrR family transcriptional regulator